MEDTTVDVAVPRQPRQDRSRERFERVIAEADALLAEAGLSGFSIPTLAERLGFTRRSIYMFFPTPYAVLNELTRRYLAQMQDALNATVAAHQDAPTDRLVMHCVFAAADFHNRHPVGRLLILGGAVTDRSYRAQELNIEHLGRIGRDLMLARGIAVPAPPPDVPIVAVELGTACFRLSHHLHGKVTPPYTVEAAFVMLQYLAEFVGLVSPPTRAAIRRELEGCDRLAPEAARA